MHGLKLYIPSTVYPKKYAHGFCFAVLCCGYTLTDFPISIRLTSLALWQSNDCPSARQATLMNMDKHFMWIHYERLHNHNKAKHNKTVCIFLGIYCTHWNSGLSAKFRLFCSGEVSARVLYIFGCVRLNKMLIICMRLYPVVNTFVMVVRLNQELQSLNKLLTKDQIPWWRHQMEALSALLCG